MIRFFKRRATTLVIAGFALSAFSGCGGGLGTPNGPFVGSGGGGSGPGTKLVNVHIKVTVPNAGKSPKFRPGYVSKNTASLVIQLSSVDGSGVSGVNATTIETSRGARNCSSESGDLICTGIAAGSPGHDVFAVTTYAGSNATGSLLSAGTVEAQIGSNGGGVEISNKLSLSLGGVIAAMKLAVVPHRSKRGKETSASVALSAYDASGAQIVGPSDFASPIALSVEGDAKKAFTLHAGDESGATLTIAKPASNISLRYNGNKDASSITVAAAVDGPKSIGADARFTLTGKQPPPPVGTIYALNLGSSDGQGATVTEYDGKASGNAAPVRTLSLEKKLYARSIAVDSSGNLYVGYFDNEFGFSPSSGLPDAKNEIAIYPPGAGGNTPPSAVITQDKTSKTALFPLYVAFDPSGELVTYGATKVDGNDGNDAVLTYAAGASGGATPVHGWAFASPTISYSGPTGLALDGTGNFYVNGLLHTSLGPSYGLFTNLVADIGNPSSTPARTIPWDSATSLTPGQTTNVAIDESEEIVIGNTVTQGSGSSTSCQARVNVFASGADGGVTDAPPLRVLTLGGVYTADPTCISTRNPLVSFFPAITLYGTSLFVADDFNNAIDAFPAGASGTVQPQLQIAGSSTQLDAPIAVVVTSLSGRAKTRSVPGAARAPVLLLPSHPSY
jgi:hypothetical protein